MVFGLKEGSSKRQKGWERANKKKRAAIEKGIQQKRRTNK